MPKIATALMYLIIGNIPGFIMNLMPEISVRVPSKSFVFALLIAWLVQFDIIPIFIKGTKKYPPQCSGMQVQAMAEGLSAQQEKEAENPNSESVKAAQSGAESTAKEEAEVAQGVEEASFLSFSSVVTYPRLDKSQALQELNVRFLELHADPLVRQLSSRANSAAKAVVPENKQNAVALVEERDTQQVRTVIPCDEAKTNLLTLSPAHTLS